ADKRRDAFLHPGACRLIRACDRMAPGCQCLRSGLRGFLLRDRLRVGSLDEVLARGFELAASTKFLRGTSRSASGMLSRPRTALKNQLPKTLILRSTVGMA